MSCFVGKYMNVLVWLGICIFGFLFGGISLGLYPYVAKMDADNSCMDCECENTCIARRKIFGDSNYVSEFMLYTYLKVRGCCRNTSRVPMHSYIIYFFLNTILVSVLFWSGGLDITRIVFSVSASMLLALSIVDWNTEYIPVEYTGVILICGLIRLFADVSNWWQYVIGLFAVSGFLYIVDRIATPMIRKKYGDDDITHVIGDGDIKLMAATGLLLGWKLNFVALGIGCVIGSIIHVILMQIKKGDRQFAFGPYLSLGVYITMICGEQLESWYLNMMRV